VNAPLYEIAERYKSLVALSDTDMDERAIADTLEAVDGELKDKALAIRAVMQSMSGDEGTIDAEIKRLEGRRQAMRNRRAALEEYLRRNMADCEINRIESPIFSITLAAPTLRLDITDESEIPDEYVTARVTEQIDRRRLLADMKAGKEVPGARLVEARRALKFTEPRES